MAFRKKFSILEEFQPDVAIIQECESIQVMENKGVSINYTDVIWQGNNQNKGISIMTFNGFKIEVLENTDQFKYIIPVRIYKDQINIIILAVRTQLVDNNLHISYVAQAARAFKHYHNILSNENIIIIGDFNSNAIWDFSHPKEYNHSQMVNLLAENNISSIYHNLNGIIHGKELDPTLYMYRKEDKPYHVDYCFVCDNLQSKIKDFTIGKYGLYNNDSDHMPLFLSVEI